MMQDRFTCNFCILKDTSTRCALGVLCVSEDVYIYGMRKYYGNQIGIYVDITYLANIGENWKEYEKFISHKNQILYAQRDGSDPILKKDPDWLSVMLVPWQFAIEFETSDQGVFIINMVYNVLKVIGRGQFVKLSKEH